MGILSRVTFALCTLLAFAGLQAAPPTLTGANPSGGRRGTTVEVTALGSFDKWPVQVWIGGKGVTVEPGKEKGNLSFRIADDAEPGVRYLRLFDDSGASPLRPFVVGTLPEMEEKEPNDEIAKAPLIERPGAVVNGKLQKGGDVDCFDMKLDAGQVMVASLMANHVLKSPMDALMQIASADGFVLARNNDEGDLDPRIVFTAPKAGVYTVRVFAFPSAPDSTIKFAGGDNYQYRLTVTTAPFVDHAWPLAIARNAKGEAELRGWNLGDKLRRLPFPTTEESFTTLFHADFANAVPIRREPHACFDETHMQPLKPPFTRSGRVPAGKADGFAMTAAKGKALRLEIESAALGFPLSPVLRVLDSSGKQLAKAEPPAIGKDCSLELTPPSDGQYRIEVGDLFCHGGDRFVYRLRVTPVEPDFELTVASDRFTLVKGKPLEIPVTIARRGGFAKSIDLGIVGLPDGLKCEVADTSDKKGNKTLKLTGDTAFSGPIRILGRAEGMERSARATLADLEIVTPDLWLSLAAEPPPPEPKKKKK